MTAWLSDGHGAWAAEKALYNEQDAARDADGTCLCLSAAIHCFGCRRRSLTVNAIAAGAWSGIAKQELALISQRT
jgi:hypothetical protein